MNKKVTSLFLLTLLGAGIGFATTQPTTHAAYKWVKTKSYNDIAYHAKSTKSAYIWNKYHTKKLHNLRNYPYATWHLSQSVKMVNGKKAAVYYKVVNYRGGANGYVWRGYLAKGPNNRIKDPAANGGVKTKTAVRQAILTVMKGTVPDKALQAVADTGDRLITSDSYEYFKGQLPKDEQSQFILLGSTNGGQYDKALLTGKMTYNEYLKTNITNQLQEENLSLSTITGYRIGINVGTSGGAFILLLPPK